MTRGVSTTRVTDMWKSNLTSRRLRELPRDRRGGVGIGSGGERDVAFAGEQAGGGVEADPARAGEIDLGPGVEIGEVGLGTGRAAVDRLHVGGQLDEIAGDEPGGEAELAANLDEQPGRVAAGTALEPERFLDRSARPAPSGRRT